MTSATLGALQEALLGWYARHCRQLPWRQTQDPYAIWVAEVMLQQTQVSTVIPYYERFLRQFPSVAALAAAPLEAVLKAWEGLGYYARARHLHRAAQVLVREHGGRLPQTREALLRLPGIGKYTAGAIASIAFGLDEPVLDGNVTRVLARLFAVQGDIRHAQTQQHLWDLARALVPPGAGRPFQPGPDGSGRHPLPAEAAAVLSLPSPGALPGRAQGAPESLPRRARRKPLPHHEAAAAVVWQDGRVLLHRRAPTGLLGGLWDFPSGLLAAGESPAAGAVRAVREQLGMAVRVQHHLATVQHGYTHFRLTLHAFACVPSRTSRHRARTWCGWRRRT
ncbi:MAG: A/G-specific adenine glycosylase [Candidatus Tectimicrobiota bacterium]|nr:MAG: A/G-specific adenine glycosylase [Candidatus Tectomicrobia bacterium]